LIASRAFLVDNELALTRKTPAGVAIMRSISDSHG
jgi:hypothetical protein